MSIAKCIRLMVTDGTANPANNVGASGMAYSLLTAGYHWIGIEYAERKANLSWKMGISSFGKDTRTGVGFLINKQITTSVSTFKSISERIIQITLKLNKNYLVKILQVYAPTISHSDQEIETFLNWTMLSNQRTPI